MEKSARQSNFELLRILAMTMIVVWHIIVHGLRHEVSGSMFAMSFLVYGVNLFVLISGYWGIKLKPKSLFSFLGQYVFYAALLCFVANVIATPPTYFSKSFLWQLLFPFSFTGPYWFVNKYIVLMLISPFLNAGLRSMTSKEKLWILLILGYLSCIAGYGFKNDFNTNGYNLAHFIFLYVLGNFIRCNDFLKTVKVIWWILIFVVMSLCTYFLSIPFANRVFFYNSPFVVLGSIAVFYIFVNLPVKNNSTINYIASCMFPVYLLQDGFLGRTFYAEIYNRFLADGRVDFGFIAVYCVGLFLAAIIIESIRRPLMRPLVSWLDRATVCIWSKIKNVLNVA